MKARKRCIIILMAAGLRVLSVPTTPDSYDPLRALARRIIFQALLDRSHGLRVDVPGLLPWGSIAGIHPEKLRQAFALPAEQICRTLEQVRAQGRK